MNGARTADEILPFALLTSKVGHPIARLDLSWPGFGQASTLAGAILFDRPEKYRHDLSASCRDRRRDTAPAAAKWAVHGRLSADAGTPARAP